MGVKSEQSSDQQTVLPGLEPDPPAQTSLCEQDYETYRQNVVQYELDKHKRRVAAALKKAEAEGIDPDEAEWMAEEKGEANLERLQQLAGVVCSNLDSLTYVGSELCEQIYPVVDYLDMYYSDQNPDADGGSQTPWRSLVAEAELLRGGETGALDVKRAGHENSWLGYEDDFVITQADDCFYIIDHANQATLWLDKIAKTADGELKKGLQTLSRNIDVAIACCGSIDAGVLLEDATDCDVSLAIPDGITEFLDGMYYAYEDEDE